MQLHILYKHSQSKFWRVAEIIRYYSILTEIWTKKFLEFNKLMRVSVFETMKSHASKYNDLSKNIKIMICWFGLEYFLGVYLYQWLHWTSWIDLVFILFSWRWRISCCSMFHAPNLLFKSCAHSDCAPCSMPLTFLGCLISYRHIVTMLNIGHVFSFHPRESIFTSNLK